MMMYVNINMMHVYMFFAFVEQEQCHHKSTDQSITFFYHTLVNLNLFKYFNIQVEE